MRCKLCDKETTTTIDGLCCQCHTMEVMRTQNPVSYGWECPRCGRIHSPLTQTCDCPPKYTIKTGHNSNE